MQSRPEYSVSLLLNNDSNFAQLFRQHIKGFSNECQLPSQYLNWVFKVSASCDNTASKSLSKWYDITELLWRIIPYWTRQSSAQQCWLVWRSVPVLHHTWQSNGLRSGDLKSSRLF